MTGLASDKWSPFSSLTSFSVRPVPTLPPQPRNDDRPLEDYPRMSGCNCLMSSRELAAAYPELELRVGFVSFRGDKTDWRARATGRVLAGLLGMKTEDLRLRMPHAWCVNARGEIVDMTFEPPDWALDLEYVENEELSELSSRS